MDVELVVERGSKMGTESGLHAHNIIFGSKPGHSKRMKPRPAFRFPWWMELAVVDFRHAAWPWLIYMVAIFSFWFLPGGPAAPDKPYNFWLLSIVAGVLAGSAVVARIFSADFAHSTISALLSAPRSRAHVWLVRFAVILLLLITPVIVCAIPLPHGKSKGAPPFMLSAAIVAFHFAFYYASLGGLLGILLKRPLLVWSAILISPLVFLLLSVAVQAILGIHLGSDPAVRNLASPSTSLFWYFVVIEFAAVLLSWRVWLRLEVRS